MEIRCIPALFVALLLTGVSSAQSQHFFASNRAFVNPRPFVAPPSIPATDGRRSQYEESPRFRGNIPEQPTVSGRRAIVRRGIAYAPAEAPLAVKRLIWATNRIVGKPYKWGGGHGSFRDSGYDCSGTVSYALHHAGVLRSPLVSSGFIRWGERGRGDWVTVYSRNGHSFMVVAGLRLDTTGMSARQGPRWHHDMRSTRGFAARCHPLL